MALGGGMSCVKYLMFLFNLLFAVTGLIIIIVGAKAQINAHPYISYTGENFYSSGPIVLIVIGVIIFIVSFFGCFGAVNENRCMIITFASFLLIIFAAEIAVGIAGYVKHRDLETSVLRQLNETMTHYSDNKDVKQAFDILQTDLQCCGINGSQNWAEHGLPIPASCCSASELKPDGKRAQCDASNPHLYTKGCLDSLVEMFKHIAMYLGGVGIGIAIVQLLGVIFACCLQRAIGSEYETV